MGVQNLETIRWKQIEETFYAALARSGPERERALTDGCGSDLTLRAEVESLLQAHDSADALFETPAFVRNLHAPENDVGSTAPAASGERIGCYTLHRILGAGGMGVVWEAQQDHPKRAVALKLMRPGLVAPAMARRFEHEAEILARLQHPGIAQIHEAGTHTSAAGSIAYFAMELVHGAPITTYADQHRLDLRDRLELFTRICEAVEHAHQKGVVHRDLKPGNILVNDNGRPKILDFGIARTMDSDVQITTHLTEVGQLMGSFPYMSPEQVGGRRDQIDTRSDVYSLGVVLYELLTGQLPYDLADKALPEAARMIRESEPVRLGSIRPALRGDLETIVGKSLEKEPARRYASVSQFASDIHRFLRNEPIAARPASAMYQLRKFAARHRKASLIVCSLLLLNLAATAVAIGLSILFANERDRAQAAQSEEVISRHSAEQVATFLERLFEQGDPFSQATRDPKVRDLIAAGAQRLDTELADQPLVRARLSTVIGGVYCRLGEYPKSRELLESAEAIVRRERGDRHLDLMPVLTKLGMTLTSMGSQDEAYAVSLEILEISIDAYGEDSEEVAGAYEDLGAQRFYAGDPERAIEYHNKALEIRRDLFGEESLAVAESKHNIGYALLRSAKPQEALTLLTQALDLKERLGASDVSIGLSCEGLAESAFALGDLPNAEAYAQRQLAAFHRAHHDQHPDVARALNNVAFLAVEAKRFDEAETFYREALAIRRSVLGDSHPDVAWSLASLGTFNLEQNDLEDAIALHEEALQIRRDAFGRGHDAVAWSAQSLGETYRRSGRSQEAEELLLEAYAILRSNHGPNHTSLVPTLKSLIALGQAEDAQSGDDRRTAQWEAELEACNAGARTQTNQE